MNPEMFPLVCADTETNGLDSRVDEIVEITLTEFNISGIRGETFSTLCYPKSGIIPFEVTNINGITIDMVQGKPNYLEDGVREKVAEIIGSRTLVGQNIESFDLKFMKVKPQKVEDTLIMARRRFPGKSNKLKTLCNRLNIPWNDKESHRATYDVDRTIEAYLKLKNFEIKQAERSAEAPIFAAHLAQKVSEATDPSNVGVVPSEKEKKLIATQAYSYSRINLYKQCPLKWFIQYVKGIKQPDEPYLKVGSVVHKIAERSGEWCFRELFANKFVIFAKKKSFEITSPTITEVSQYYNIPLETVTMHDYGRFIFEHPELIKDRFNIQGLYKLIFIIEKEVAGEPVEVPSMPPLSDYELIIQQCVNQFQVTDPEIVADIRRLSERFYRNANFSMMPGNMVLTEKRIAFDREWRILSDFFANNTFFRAIIDVIYYFGRTILIKDYKTSRTMLSEKDMPDEIQLLIYVLMVYKFIPRESYDKIVIEIDYIRFGKQIQFEIDDVEFYANKALKWILDAIQDIEKEMLKDDGTAFAPVRNEYCHTCHIAADGICPLFNKQCINQIDDPFNFVVDNADDCVKAWKRVEANKSENLRLTKLCKTFVKSSEQTIRVDEHAILDFYTKKDVSYDPVKTVQLLLAKKVPIEHILSWMSFPPSQVQKFLEYKELELTEEELENISTEGTKTEFKAVTEKEAKSKGYFNS